MKKRFDVYMLSITSKMIYTGMTGNLERRIYEHKNTLVRGFTKNITFIHWSITTGRTMLDMLYKREKQIKGWSRKKKMELIESMNLNEKILLRIGFLEYSQKWSSRATDGLYSVCNGEPDGSQRLNDILKKDVEIPRVPLLILLFLMGHSG